jgi:activator of 2-hydroxyglutaryl-CoA dehydratase
VASLAKRVGILEEVFMSGGVARNGGVRDALEKELKVSIQYSEYSQLMGALGAAIIAFEKR